MNWRISCLALLSLATLAPRSVSAQSLLVDLQTSNISASGSDFTMGWDFTTTVPIQVVGFGVFDFQANGLGRSHQLGLWRTDGTLITQTVLGFDNSFPVASVFNEGQWMVTTISPITLPAGTYIVGGDYRSNDIDPFFSNGVPLPLANITLGQARTGGVGSQNLTFPNSPWIDSPGVWGPNLYVNTLSRGGGVAPEPATVVLLALGGLGLLRRRRAH